MIRFHGTSRSHGSDFSIITGDGADTVDTSSVGSKAEATMITGAGDDTIIMASGADMSKFTIDAGDGTDTFKFSSNITIGEDDSIANIENFVSTKASASVTVTISNMDTLASIDTFTGSGSAASKYDKLSIVGTGGDDTIDLSGIAFEKATDVVKGGGGNDTVKFTTNNLAGETFIFEATASDNGVDNISNFVAGATNGDILDFSLFKIDGNSGGYSSWNRKCTKSICR